VSGPAIPGKLTTRFAVTSNEAKNASTVRATLPTGIFALGITRPNTYREYSSEGTYQLAEAHSLGFSGEYATESRKDQGIGDFTLPERASDSEFRRWNAEVSQFSTLSSRSLFEVELNAESRTSETIPLSEDVKINVLDAFNGGGAQNQSEWVERSYRFDTMYTQLGEVFTFKAGMEAEYQSKRSLSTNNFGGTFTFSSLSAYLAGLPLNYRVTRGNPLLEVDQVEAGGFLQADAALTSQFTLMFGLRYDAQRHLDDWNNFSPRLSFAYAPSEATVVRGGAGVFYYGLEFDMLEDLRQFDGTSQFEIVIDNPSYPDPFAAGVIRRTFPSVRVMDPNLMAPSVRVGMVSIERTFLSNLLVSASYDYQREFHRLRMRNLNAPYDASSPLLRACRPEQPDETCVRPDPTQGNILSLESSGNDIKHNLELNVRKRFSIFNVSAEYQLQHVSGDVQGAEGAQPSDHYDLRRDWGRSPTPLHRVETTVNARLPLGIFLTAEMEANSGRYYSMRTGRDGNRDNNVNDRPDGVPPNSLRGPSYLNFDFNISKAFFFGGSGSGPNINAFANVTNALNHIHYGTPSGVLTSPNFGRSTSATDPREIEAGIRFQF
jgi:hypothetical protein